MDWFLYDYGFRLERVKNKSNVKGDTMSLAVTSSGSDNKTEFARNSYL